MNSDLIFQQYLLMIKMNYATMDSNHQSEKNDLKTSVEVVTRNKYQYVFYTKFLNLRFFGQ